MLKLRLALTAVIAFYGLNDRRLALTNDEAYDLVISAATGERDTDDPIAALLSRAAQPAGRTRGWPRVRPVSGLRCLRFPGPGQPR